MQFTARHIIYWMLAAVLLVILIFDPQLVLYVPAAIIGLLFVAYFIVANSIHIAVQKTIDDTYRIPGTEVVLRTKFADWGFATAPYLELRAGSGPPLKYCMAGPEMTRAQLYAVESGGLFLETNRDAFLIRTNPLTVDGPPTWMFSKVKGGPGGACDIDGLAEAPIRERVALKSGLKLTYVGAFDLYGKYWKYWPAEASPEQRTVPDGVW